MCDSSTGGINFLLTRYRITVGKNEVRTSGSEHSVCAVFARIEPITALINLIEDNQRRQQNHCNHEAHPSISNLPQAQMGIRSIGTSLFFVHMMFCIKIIL